MHVKIITLNASHGSTISSSSSKHMRINSTKHLRINSNSISSNEYFTMLKVLKTQCMKTNVVNDFYNADNFAKWNIISKIFDVI